ncbi:MAG: ribonuclease P protein component [Candidatus Acidoferrales bacterium]
MTQAVPQPALQSGPAPFARMRTRDFDRVYRDPARRRRSARFQVVARRNALGQTRWGISVKVRLGNAVVRNRVKRRLREILRRAALPKGWDVVVQPQSAEVARADFANLRDELRGLLERVLQADKKS